MVEGAGRLLPPEEPEAGALLAGVFDREGIEVRTGTTARAVRHDGTSFTLACRTAPRSPGTRCSWRPAGGPTWPGIGAAVLGVDETARAIPVDDRLRVAPGVWAIGDITGHGAFTHMSMYQADIVVRDILGAGGLPPPSTTRCRG